MSTPFPPEASRTLASGSRIFCFAPSSAEAGLLSRTPPVRRYSVAELEAIRPTDLDQQRRWWETEVYGRLESSTRSEFDQLRRPNQQQEQQTQQDQQQQGRDGGKNKKKKNKKKTDKNETVMKNTERDEILGGQVLAEENAEFGSDDTWIRERNYVMEKEWEHEDDYDDEIGYEEYDSIRKPAFLVEGEPDFDSGPPLDGFEYLRRVRWEASQIPDVKVVKLDSTKLKSEQTPYMPDIPEIPECPTNLLPSKDWEASFLAEFSDIRNAFSESENSMDQSDCSDREVTHKRLNFSQWPEDFPTMTTLLSMNANSRAAFLRRCIDLFEESKTLSRDKGLWLFALCAAVDIPLLPETSASLRCLLRKCSTLLAGKTERDDEVAMLSILVTISGKYFGQSEKRYMRR